MVPIAPDHILDVLYRQVLPRGIADELPARDLFEHQQPKLVAGIEEVRRLRIVRCADYVDAQVLAQHDCIPPLHSRRHRATNVWIGLVPVESPQLQVLPVEEESIGSKSRLAESDSNRMLVRDPCARNGR